MDSSYDEDIMDNVFFQALQKDFSEIFLKAIDESCIICVPRAGSLPSYTISIDDILGHILIPNDELPESHFQTLSGRSVRISNRVVTVEYDVGYQFSTHILFEETYYTDDFLKYKLLCVERPFEPKSDSESDSIFEIKSLRDCMYLLWVESGDYKIVEQLDKSILNFMSNEEGLENLSLQQLKDKTGILYANCLQIVFTVSRLREKATHNRHTTSNIKLAIESYLLHKVFSTLFKCISVKVSHNDSKLNKIIRNSADLQLRDLGVRKDLYSTIPKAKHELGKINGYSTVLGKLGCIKKMIAAISKSGDCGSVVPADDLLPVIIFILIKTNISNWYANLTFLKQFHFSSNTNRSCHGEEDFLITTLEAAIEYIKSGVFLGPSTPEGQSSSSSSEDILEDVQNDITTMANLFQQISRGNLSEVQSILEKHHEQLDFSNLSLCHPLCDCDKCHKTITTNSQNSNPTVFSCDDAGMTALHIAAMYGKPLVADYLISQGANVEATDLNGYTPMHHAALRGHQSIVLLLAQNNANLNASDNSLNTPLHLCCLNGHDECVKALTFHHESSSRNLFINAQNSCGDTPLHHAAKWGYLKIVELLVDMDANSSIVNRRKQTPFDVSNNCKVSEILGKHKSRIIQQKEVANFDFQDDWSLNHLHSGYLPNSTDEMRLVEKLFKAISRGDINLACYYLGVDPSVVDCDKRHPLDGPSKNPLKPKVSPHACNAEGMTALHVATVHGNLQLVKILISNGANLDLQTRLKLTSPLILAAQHQNVKIVEALLKAGCNVNLQDHRGDTATHIAVVLGHRKMLECLLEYKPNLCVRNKNGLTALEEAESKVSLGIINILKAALLRS